MLDLSLGLGVFRRSKFIEAGVVLRALSFVLSSVNNCVMRILSWLLPAMIQVAHSGLLQGLRC